MSNTKLHRQCWCGTEAAPILSGSIHTGKCVVHCPACGCRTIVETCESRAWAAWDNYELAADDENYTIYDLMTGNQND